MTHFLPRVVTPGVAIVVSPLVMLMHEQAQCLPFLGIRIDCQALFFVFLSQFMVSFMLRRGPRSWPAFHPLDGGINQT